MEAFFTFYVSTSTLIIPEEERSVQAIVDWSRGWNNSVGITGALVFTEVNFCQFLEGPKQAVLDLMEKIKADHRHMHVDVIEQGWASERRFHGWSLCYSGPPTPLEALIAPLSRRSPDAPVHTEVWRLVDAMQAMAALGTSDG